MNTLLHRVVLSLLLLCNGMVDSAHASAYQYNRSFSAIASGAGATDQQFGTQVAIDGDLAVVATVATAVVPGKVHTFERVSNVWTRRPEQEFELYGTDAATSLSLKNGFLIVGSNRPTGSNVRIYRREAAAWTRELDSYSTDATLSVAIDGQIAVSGRNTTNGTVAARRRSNTAPFWSTAVGLTPSVVQAGARFGSAVSISAGTVVVGAPLEDVTAGNGVVRSDAGAGYVFILDGDTWSQQARFVEADADLRNNNYFGTAVAMSGADPAVPDRMLIAAARSSAGQTGRVLGYTRSNGVWTLRHTTLSSQPQGTQDGFGCALRLDGHWAVVGACESNAVGNARGAVSILRFSTTFSSVLSSTQRTDPLADEYHSIGTSIAIDRNGPTLMIGNPFAQVYGNNDEGVVLVGTGIVSNTIAQPIRTLDLGQGLDSALAGMTSFDGDTLAMSAFAESIGNQLGRGAVYVRRRDANGIYALETKLLAPDGLSGDQFGRALALVGESLLVAAPERSVQGLNAAGLIYAFRRNAGIWSLEAQLMAAVPAIQSQFGRGLTFDGTTAVSCALDDTSSIFTRSSNGNWVLAQTLAHGCETPQLQGDRLILNNPYADVSGSENIGQVSTYTRSGGMWQLQTTLFGGQAGQQFGYQIASENNLLVVTSTGPNGTLPPVQLFRANGSGAWIPETTLQPNDPGLLCYSTAVSLGRVFIGCPSSGDGRDAVYVFDQSGSAWLQTQKLVNPFDSTSASGFGGSIRAYPGGLLFISALGEDIDFENQGATFLFREPQLLIDGFE